MRVAGIDIPNAHIFDLAVLLRRGDYAHPADTLEGAIAANQADVALTVPDRIAILSVLDEPPNKALAQLRAVLLQEHVGRVRDGLA